ncbi:hypothetical protein QYS48_17630 [Marivirga arenosa]|uniref:Uncharacterized protein n=1 Tax=Marivirga arenosa TaxID=3059076 RepID=A0AA49GEE1_9BACT|nr:hypothetical protein [Marivirga sp. ABR2-2]WKK84031.2 hypothetical protein QYS48_17630 [Marivirga sp. ABR2-2]
MEASNWHEQRKKNLKALAIWTFAWVSTLALVTFGPKFLWEGNQVFTYLAFFLNLGFGVGMIFANRNHINGLDELDKKITFDAMAIALGVGVIGGLSFSVMDITNMIGFDAEISFLVILISITYLIATLVGKYRYK